MTTTFDQSASYARDADPAEQADARARGHRRIAYEAMERDPEGPLAALTHALLAVEARVEELCCYVARLG
jgi:hypothetical protein